MASSQHYGFEAISANIHSLAAISDLIRSYLARYSVDENDEKKFLQLLDRIRAIETTCTGWFKAEYKVMSEDKYASKIKENRKRTEEQLDNIDDDSVPQAFFEQTTRHIETQEELNAATDYAQQDVLNFLDIAVKKLWEDINFRTTDLNHKDDDVKDVKQALPSFHDLTKFDLDHATKLPQARRYIVQNRDTVKLRQELFKKINESLVIILKNNNRNFDEKKFQSEKEHKRPKIPLSYYHYPENREEYYDFASELGARYIKYQQTSEPLRFTDKRGIPGGSCYGHVKKWAQEIQSNGVFHSFPYNDYAAQTMQANQDQYRPQGVVGYLRNHVDTVSYNSHLDILSMLDTLLNKIGSDVYLLDLIYKSDGRSGHSVGIRKIPGTNEVELFDPNFGVFVFPNMDQLKTWFTLHFLNCYYANNSGKIYLSKLSEQPAVAKASILPIKVPKREKIKIPSVNDQFGKFEYSEKYHTALKVNVCAVIDTEITRLSATLLKKSFSQSKIEALKKLKVIITGAPKGMPLAAIVARWLAMPSKNDPSLSYRDVIERRRHALGNVHSDTFNFIINLTKNHEICPSRLEAIEVRVLKQIEDIVKQDWTSVMPYFSHGVSNNGKKIPQTIERINEILKDEKLNTPIKKLKKIHDICKEKQQGFFSEGVVARTLSWRSKETEELYKILKRLSQRPGALMESFTELRNFRINNFLPKNSKSKSPRPKKAA